jgi:CubicO group peptidase (beta-lactamase class C family)
MTIDVSAFAAAAALAQTHATKALLVVVDGNTVAEHAWDGWDETSTRDIASAQKVVTAFLIGMAQERGLLSIDDPVGAHIGEGWTRLEPEEERAITLRHLLTMTSGLTTSFEREAAPGTVWRYVNPAYHQLRFVLEVVHGRPLQDVCTETLFGPLGMTSTTWRDRPGFDDPNGRNMSGLITTTRDLARFGQCVLDGGRAGDEVVLGDAAYLRAMTTPSQELNPGYGYLWWLNGQEFTLMPGPRSPRVDGALIPSAPADLVAGLGAADQKLYVVPGRRTIVVRLGDATGPPAAAGTPFDRALWSALAPALDA